MDKTLDKTIKFVKLKLNHSPRICYNFYRDCPNPDGNRTVAYSSEEYKYTITCNQK